MAVPGTVDLDCLGHRHRHRHRRWCLAWKVLKVLRVLRVKVFSILLLTSLTNVERVHVLGRKPREDLSVPTIQHSRSRAFGNRNIRTQEDERMRRCERSETMRGDDDPACHYSVYLRMNFEYNRFSDGGVLDRTD